MNAPDGTALVPIDAVPLATLQPAATAPTVIRPLETADAIVEAWEQFQGLKDRIWTAADYQSIGETRYPKKSAWRKVATAFGLTCEIVKEERRELDKGFVWEVTVRATAPNGRSNESTGSCASTERRYSHEQHDVRATAETRAKNRAISDLVGGGIVSAEEMGHDDHSGALDAANKVIEQLRAPIPPDRARLLVEKFLEACSQAMLPTDWQAMLTAVVQHRGNTMAALATLQQAGQQQHEEDEP